MRSVPLQLYIKKAYRRSLYRPCKILERAVRHVIFSLLPSRWNGFQLFRVPTGVVEGEGNEVIKPLYELRSAPRTIELSSHERFCELHVKSSGATVAVVPGGYATATAAHLNGQGRLIKKYTEYFPGAGASFGNHNLFRFRPTRMLSPIKHVEGKVASLTVDCQENYYHWLFDALPKLKMLQEAQITPSHYFADISKRFQKESLELLGIHLSQVIAAKQHMFISAQELLLTSFPCIGHPPLWAMDFLRHNIRDKVQAHSPKRIFISRSDADYRKILNEEELYPLLKREGFITIRPGTHTFAEQVALFKEAQVVLAPHGAGLSNIVFCPPHAKIIEIFPTGIPCICFWAIANLLKLEYHYFRGEEENKQHLREDAAYRDIIVDPRKLVKTLKRLA